jgi:hypothetical protein
VNGYRLDDWGSIPGRGTHFSLCHFASRLGVGATQPPYKLLPVAVSSEVKQAEYEADRSTPYAFMAWCMVVKYRSNFTFIFKQEG